MTLKYGKQIGVIVHGNGINMRAWGEAEKAKGYVVVYCDGYARIHEPK